jgi:peptidoglycan/LPS O-acetylase OafA/YrhL
MRAHYLCSPALVGISVLVLLLVPLDSSLQSAWVVGTALPYYALYARDLRQSRYRWLELPQVYALGLMLLPVTLAGVLRSLQQIVTGRTSAFGRTPKVEDRTPTPPIHLVFQLALLSAIGVTGVRYVLDGRYGLALFCAVNFTLIVVGLALLIGSRNVFVDLLSFIKRTSPHPHPRDAQTSPAAQTALGERGRIAAMDGLRAYAISLVFLVHFLSQYFNGTTSPRRIDFDAFQPTRADSIIDSIAHYFWASHYGVDLFFLLSGFLIYCVIVRPAFSYPAFLRNRLVRLYPAFVVALAVYCVYIAYSWNQTYDWLTVAANMLMLQGIWELGIKPIIVPTWSLTFEWLFYLVFPIVLLLPKARAKVSLHHIVLMGVAIAVTIVPIGPHYIRFLMFVAGAALASTSAATVRAQLQSIPDLIVLGVYVLANLLFVQQQDYYRFIPIFLVTSLLLVAKIIHGDGILHRMFSLEPLRRLGRVSYSFDLFHGLVIIIVCDHVTPFLHGLPEAVTFVLLLGCSFACSVAVASVAYRVLEQPYFQRRHTRPAFAMNTERSASG